MASALSMGMIRSRESEFGRASSGPTSLRQRATGSKQPRQTTARPGRQTGCRTLQEFAEHLAARRQREIHRSRNYIIGESRPGKTVKNSKRFRTIYNGWREERTK